MSFNCTNYQFSTGEHRDKKVILVQFPYNQQYRDELRLKFPTARWSRTKNCWYILDVKSVRIELGMEPKTESGKAVMGYIHAINQAALQKMNQLLLLKAYSPNTIRTYCVEFAQLLYILNPTCNLCFQQISPKWVREKFILLINNKLWNWRLKTIKNLYH